MTTAAKISIINGLILVLLTVLTMTGIVRFDLILSYQWHKILHIAGVVIFMGNMITGPCWYSIAYYSKDIRLLKFANKGLQLTDMYLTVPGISLTVINGLFLASVYGDISNQRWLYYSTLLLLVMWALSIPVIWLQEKMYQTIANEPENTQKTDRLLTWWGILGTLVTIPPTIIFYWMVVKPV